MSNWYAHCNLNDENNWYGREWLAGSRNTLVSVETDFPKLLLAFLITKFKEYEDPSLGEYACLIDQSKSKRVWFSSLPGANEKSHTYVSYDLGSSEVNPFDDFNVDYDFTDEEAEDFIINKNEIGSLLPYTSIVKDVEHNCDSISVLYVEQKSSTAIVIGLNKASLNAVNNFGDALANSHSIYFSDGGEGNGSEEYRFAISNCSGCNPNWQDFSSYDFDFDVVIQELLGPLANDPELIETLDEILCRIVSSEENDTLFENSGKSFEEIFRELFNAHPDKYSKLKDYLEIDN